MSDDIARRVTLAHPSEASEAERESIRGESFRRHLGRAHAAVGDAWGEFVSGGCGRRNEVTLRVVAVEGGTRVTPDTEFDYR